MGNHRVVWLDYHGAQIASINQDKTQGKTPLVSGAAVPFNLDSTQFPGSTTRRVRGSNRTRVPDQRWGDETWRP